MSELTPGFIVAHGHRLEDLTDVAVKFTQNYPLAPLQQETVLVQSNGIAQWLKINLAQASGIAAMMDVTLPARFQWQAYRAVLGSDIPTTSPFDKDRLTWRIHRLLPDLIQTSTCFSALQHYTKDDDDGRKLFQLSGRLADLFDQYAVYRADWLDSWVKGNDQLDGAQTVSDEQRWQPELWRAVSKDIGTEDYWNNRAQLHQRFVTTVSSLTERPAGIPPRVVVFGISSLPQQMLEVLDAIKGYTQILLCVHNPSQYHWADIVDGKEALREAVKVSSRLQHKPDLPDDPAEDELHQLAHPLLASWGKQGRDYIRLLDLYDETLTKQQDFTTIKLELFDPHPTDHLLGQLQDDILNLRPLIETQQQWPTVAADDRSIQFHICHSPQRELEVLHDQLLQAFAEDPELRPRDIMVMLPDVNTYAPYINAVFGRYHRGQGQHDPRAIPYTIADQGQRQQRPLMIAVEQLLHVDQLRFTQTDLFNLLAVPAVQHRFAIDEDELPQIKQWASEAGARWGLSGEQRQQFFINTADSTNSWWFGLRRMLAGYAIGEELSEQPWQGVEPYSEVAGLGADLAGRLAEVVRSLEQWWQYSRTQKSVSDWVTAGEWLLDTFFSPVDETEELLHAKLIEQLYQLSEVSAEAENTSPLRLAIFKEAWLERIDEQQLNQRFLAGAVNFATLMPMRAIPFKRVCILGMNESEYPRSTTRVDFDLMADSYRPGDRSRRDDDRYLFLEALLSARDCFYISWLGFSPKDNSERTPSVLVSQLREHLSLGWDLEPQALTDCHRLQPFHTDYFDQQAAKGYFSYASEWLNAYQPKPEEQPTAAALGSADDNNVTDRQIPIEEVKRFVEEPARLYFNWRLDTYFYRQQEDALDSEAFELDNLTRWALTQRLVEAGKKALLRDHSDDNLLNETLTNELNRMQREGELGLSVMAQQHYQQLWQQAEEILMVYRLELGDSVEVSPLPVPVQFRHQHLVIEDSVSGLHTTKGGERCWVVTSASNIVEKKNKGVSDNGWKHASGYYVGLLLLNLQHPTRLVIISKGGCRMSVASMPASQAEQQLQALMQLMEQAATTPLPMHQQLAMAWLATYDANEQDEAMADQQVKVLYEEGPYGQPSLASSTDYCGRVAQDYEAIKRSSSFKSFIDQLYDPMRKTMVPEGKV